MLACKCSSKISTFPLQNNRFLNSTLNLMILKRSAIHNKLLRKSTKKSVLLSPNSIWVLVSICVQEINHRRVNFKTHVNSMKCCWHRPMTQTLLRCSQIIRVLIIQWVSIVNSPLLEKEKKRSLRKFKNFSGGASRKRDDWLYLMSNLWTVPNNYYHYESILIAMSRLAYVKNRIINCNSIKFILLEKIYN